MRRHSTVCAGVALALVAAAPAARAGVPFPALAFQLGRSFAIESPVSGAFDDGGFTLSAAALWPWEDRFRFGAAVVAADFGGEIRNVTIPGSVGNPPKDYGQIDLGHRGTWGAVWRTDVLGPKLGRVGRSYLTGNYGYFRVHLERVGKQLAVSSGVGGGVGLGIERALTTHQTLALVANQTWMSDDFTGRYGSAALEWSWR